ncbi:LacI family transcriptional regulator [Rhodococcus sp. 06-156-3C]|uniref:LacI family DNA-binding transcriptional regulator n=1 Tax=Nocardiaceae TaxID=85025 RepID=UPI000523075C|nr:MULTISPECIES: LacI family DNA-binding transcriptional regulator [Rhodococcus]OZD18211.1 LacI family transcriptional regulator [Rhodococcus sp. 06-156-4C]OZD18808.1 LacI family transcriptional regulator [Rhodococcus sp. 06-156-3C]OZD22318.1 LacI family transcriptional regulator [Rhodococcus sp. 06-156-4a]OZD34124.1 LacI family transcriptional regulator [Rhodococcus sp. 06-156-3b]OZD38861.1 LacI family transcriptional regulator [Rhodococcus sp. 06-156-3]
MPRITSKDVAATAGVSQTTVSFVLNGREDKGISTETRDHVLAAAHNLGYVPSAAARSLRTGTSSVILCLIPDFPVTQAMDEFKIELSRAFADDGLSCVFLHHTATHSPPGIALWQQVNPAVVVAFGEVDTEAAASMRRAGIPLVQGVFGDDGATITGLDQRRVGALQLEHLVEKGHSRVGYAAVADLREQRFGRPRLSGFADASLKNGFTEPVVAVMADSTASADEALATFVEADVTGVAAFNDLAAFALIAACRRRGVRVPSTLAVIGVDNLRVASLVSPQLSTIAMDLATFAARLAVHIVDLLRGSRARRPAGADLGAFQIIERETT